MPTDSIFVLTGTVYQVQHLINNLFFIIVYACTVFSGLPDDWIKLILTYFTDSLEFASIFTGYKLYFTYLRYFFLK